MVAFYQKFCYAQARRKKVLQCPVKYENKPLSQKELIGYRKKSRACSLAMAVLITALCGFQQVGIAGIILLGLTSAALSAFVGQAVNKGRRKADEEVVI